MTKLTEKIETLLLLYTKIHQQLQKLETDTHLTRNEDSVKLISGMSLSEYIGKNLDLVRDQLTKLKIKLNISVLGRFKSGKSTFINSIIKKRVAAVDIDEMTYSLNYITFANQEKGRIHFTDGKICELSIEELNSQLVTRRDDPEFKASINKIELLYPFNELVDINIWDTPGLGSMTKANINKTLSIIPETDVCLWILDAESLGDENDKSELDKVLLQNKPIIGIVNKMDIVGNISENKEKISKFIENVYGKIFKKLFFCSSEEAWEALNDKDTTKYRNSGVPEITDYLVKNIFHNKKELIYASVTNQLKELLSSIEISLADFYDSTTDKINEFNTFKSRIDSKTKDILDRIDEESREFIRLNVYENEKSSYLLALENSALPFDSNLFSRHIEKSSREYADKLLAFSLNRLETLWKNAIYNTQDEINEDAMSFSIAKSFNNTNSQVTFKDNNAQDPSSAIIAIGGTSAVASLLSGAGLFASVFSGVAVAAAAFYFLSQMSLDDTKHSSRMELIKIIDSFKKSFYNDIFCNSILRELYDKNEQFTKKLLDKAEKIYLRMGDLKINNQIMVNIKSANEKIPEVFTLLESEKESFNLSSKELFSNNLKKQDFFINAADPNPGIKKLEELFKNSDRFVYFVDPYFTTKALNYVNMINSNLTVKILLYYLDEKIEEHHHFIKNLTKLRENRTAPVLVRFLKFKHTGGTPLHDRFIFSNSWAIQMGNGLDVVGFKDVSISFIDNHREYQRNFFDKYWDMKYLKTEIREKQVIGYDV